MMDFLISMPKQPAMNFTVTQVLLNLELINNVNIKIFG
jgi:hypothetical protein